jgi:antitoxin VapB
VGIGLHKPMPLKKATGKANLTLLDLAICKAYAREYAVRNYAMKRSKTGKNKVVTSKAAAKSISGTASKRASIFRNGTNQAVRLPQELRFPADVKEVRIRKQGDGLLLSPIKPNWVSFFAMQVDVPDDFLEKRGDSSPQSRDPL